MEKQNSNHGKQPQSPWSQSERWI